MKIYGYKLEPKKQLRIALTVIYGIGVYQSSVILNKLGFKPNILVEELDEESGTLLNNYLRTLKIESVLRTQIKENILHKIKNGSYKGIRHLKRLPVRGQRTSTNARTNRYLAKKF